MSVSDEILSAYLTVSQHASRQFREHFGKCNLTFPQALVLSALLEQSPIPISLLAEKTGSANSTVSGIVDRLERLGLVRRQRSEEDRRMIYVALSDECRNLHEDATASVKGYFATLLDELDEGEQREILTGLLKLDRVLRKGEEERA